MKLKRDVLCTNLLRYWGTSLALLVLASVTLPVSAAPGGIAIIVNRNNSVTEISDSDLTAYYLKQKKLWSSGGLVVPINRNEGSPERELFLKRVLSKSSREMASYWIERKQISGDSPPQAVSSDSQVIGFVSSLEGGIGYVSQESLSGEEARGVKVIKRLE